jgi:hypothetical protein
MVFQLITMRVSQTVKAATSLLAQMETKAVATTTLAAMIGVVAEKTAWIKTILLAVAVAITVHQPKMTRRIAANPKLTLGAIGPTL